jgi:hypothetical protein
MFLVIIYILPVDLYVEAVTSKKIQNLGKLAVCVCLPRVWVSGGAHLDYYIKTSAHDRPCSYCRKNESLSF